MYHVMHLVMYFQRSKTAPTQKPMEPSESTRHVDTSRYPVFGQRIRTRKVRAHQRLVMIDENAIAIKHTT